MTFFVCIRILLGVLVFYIKTDINNKKSRISIKLNLLHNFFHKRWIMMLRSLFCYKSFFKVYIRKKILAFYTLYSCKLLILISGIILKTLSLLAVQNKIFIQNIISIFYKIIGQNFDFFAPFLLFLFYLIMQFYFLHLIRRNKFRLGKIKSLDLSFKRKLWEWISTYLYLICFSLIVYFISDKSEWILSQNEYLLIFLICFFILVVILRIIHIWRQPPEKRRIHMLLFFQHWGLYCSTRMVCILFFSTFLDGNNIILSALTFSLLRYIFPSLLEIFSGLGVILKVYLDVLRDIFMPRPMFCDTGLEAWQEWRRGQKQVPDFQKMHDFFDDLRSTGILAMEFTEKEKEMFHKFCNLFTIHEIDKQYPKLGYSFKITTDHALLKHRPYIYQFTHKGFFLSFTLRKFTFDSNEFLDLSYAYTDEKIVEFARNFCNSQDIDVEDTVVNWGITKEVLTYITIHHTHCVENLNRPFNEIWTVPRNDVIVLANNTKIAYKPNLIGHQDKSIAFVIGGKTIVLPNFTTLSFNLKDEFIRHSYFYVGANVKLIKQS